jgi:chitodextrinase
MSRFDGWRLRRQVIWAVVIAFCAMLLPATATAAPASGIGARGPDSGATVASTLASDHGQTRIQGFNKQLATVTVGRTVVDSVVVLPRARRIVLVQARPPGASKFVTQSRGHSAANGTFRAVYAPTKAGTWRFQIVVLANKSRDGATAGPRVVRAVDRTAPALVTRVGFLVTSDSAILSWVNPTDKDFTGVTIRRAVGPQAPTSPVGGTAVTDTTRNVTTFKDSGLAANTQYSYALFAHDASSNFSRAAVTLRTQRLPVTGLNATQVTRTSIALAWTNPDDVDFTGVTIRRADGPTPPVSATDGTFVADVDSPESTFLDTGLTPATKYSYAVFARDAAHVAGAATLTLTTRAPGTQAVLKVNPITTNSPNVTIATTVAFDASDSLAAQGTDLTEWSIDYGDGSPVDTFTGPFGPADILNTEHTFTGNGDRTVTLSVTDGNGNTDTDVVVVHVFSAPTVSIQPENGSPVVGQDVVFDVNAQTPNGTTFTSWQMDVSGPEIFFLSGIGAPAPALDPVAFNLPGTYTIDFTVTNDAGAVVFADPVIVVVGP